jgi:hypothetical protein
MRGSPFHANNIHEVVRQNNEYKKHKDQLKKINSAKGFMPDMTDEMHKMKHKLASARNFEEVNKLKVVERDNLRMLNRFLEIQRGRQLSVPKALLETDIVTSPVAEFHSMRVLNKLNESKEVIKSNH